MSKTNYAMKAPQPDSFHDEEAWKWPSVISRCDSMPDPAKLLTEEQKAAAKQREIEAFERFKRNQHKYKGTGKSTGANE